MTNQKEIGYKVVNVAWHNLDGYQELWNKADFDTKEKIVNEQGRLAIELSIPVVSKRWTYRILMVGIGIGALIGLGLATTLI